MRRRAEERDACSAEGESLDEATWVWQFFTEAGAQDIERRETGAPDVIVSHESILR